MALTLSIHAMDLLQMCLHDFARGELLVANRVEDVNRTHETNLGIGRLAPRGKGGMAFAWSLDFFRS